MPAKAIFQGDEEFAVNKKGQHVVPSGGKWAIRRSGAARASETFETQSEAVSRARALAIRQGTELYVHGRDGRIRERRSYSADPHPPKS